MIDSRQMSQKRSRRKGNEKEDGEWKCLDCCKSYLSYPAFYTHCKTKHDSKWPAYYNTPRPLDEIKRDRGRPRTNQDEQRQHEKEDQIFEFLGKLGQNNEEEDSQNNCIRHYLKQPINPVTSVNHEAFQGKDQEAIYTEIVQCLEKMNQKVHNSLTQLVLAQEAIWDFRDPLQLTNELEEFTFSNLRGVFYQLEQEKQITLVNVVCVFLGWLSRHLKKKAYQDVVIAISITAYFIRKYTELSDKNINPKDKIQLMQLKENDLDQELKVNKEQQEQKSQSQRKEDAADISNQESEKDIKQVLSTQSALYLEKVFPQYENFISYLKGYDIAQAFVSLFIDWVDVFTDVEVLLDQ